MPHFEGHRLVVNHDEISWFLAFLRNGPSPEAKARRDALFERLDQMEVTMNEDGSRSFEFTPKGKEKT